MNNVRFLAYISDPFGVRTPLYYLCDENEEPTPVSPQALSESSFLLISYECATLIDDFRRAGINSPKNLVDISNALRQCTGIPRDEGGEKHWSTWAAMAPFFSNSLDAEYFKNIFRSSVPHPDKAELVQLVIHAANALRTLWAQTIQRLEQRNEIERFFQVEIPVQTIFNHRQYNGIALDKKIINTLIETNSDEKYAAYSSIASVLGRSPAGMNFWNIRAYLHLTDVAHLSAIEDGSRLQDAFKIAAFHSEFARNFLIYIDASRDEKILQRALGEESRLYPIFNVMGTVSGRILVADPYLQQLRKRYRGLISSDADLKLQYLDYSQFEPGIVAYLSEDEALIEAYNSDDVYLSLSERMFGERNQRDLSKKIYLAFCYGMSAEGIAKLIAKSETSTEPQERFASTISDFFATFPGLTRLRIESEKLLVEHGFVGSIFGNNRHRTNQGELRAKERRWSLNQRVQATASLVFKEATIALAKEFGEDSILLPVHDAVLMQFKNDMNFESNTKRAISIMTNIFGSRCPGMRARVIASNFAA
jgi:DNA polymerase-1